MRPDWTGADATSFVRWLRHNLGKKEYRRLRRRYERTEPDRPAFLSADRWERLYDHLRWLRGMYAMQTRITPDANHILRIRLRNDMRGTLQAMRDTPKRKLP